MSFFALLYSRLRETRIEDVLSSFFASFRMSLEDLSLFAVSVTSLEERLLSSSVSSLFSLLYSLLVRVTERSFSFLVLLAHLNILRKSFDSLFHRWESDCHMFRHKCLCLEGLSEGCIVKHKIMKIDYYGECQELSSCTQDILDDFPRRMKEWLYRVMRYNNIFE